MSAYDVIGDVHGHADALERLLRAMGYVRRHGAYRHDERVVVFTGDLVDRGPAQLETVQIVRRMVDAGAAQVVLGNHELHAIGWATPDGAGGWCRPHSSKNAMQHWAFLRAVHEGSNLHRACVAWFRTIPLWLDLGGLRVVHACWDGPRMAALGTSRLSDDMLRAPAGSVARDAVDVLLKGPEIDLPAGRGYLDRSGTCRHAARLAWWDPQATTLRRAAEIPADAAACDGAPLAPLPDHPIDRMAHPGPPGPDEPPVVFGHYRHAGRPAVRGPRVACVDYGVAGGGPLVAYRWDGERDLTDDHFVSVPARHRPSARVTRPAQR